MTYRGVPIYQILRFAGLTADLSTDMTDKRNLLYFGPLENEADEAQAAGMAEAIYGAWLNEQNAEDEMKFEQCLVDARHMLLDKNYANLFHEYNL